MRTKLYFNFKWVHVQCGLFMSKITLTKVIVIPHLGNGVLRVNLNEVL